MDEMEVPVHDDELYVTLLYPRTYQIKKVVVDLLDVRAADSITIQYDFDRDGWSITREIHIEHESWTEETGEIVEVAFIPAWTLKESE